jgi:hypothetical protein
MYWQEREIFRQAVISDETATVVIDLPRSNILSALLLDISATNGTTAGAQYPPEMISRIEVIADGSKEIYSMTGVEAFLATYGLFGRIPPCKHDKGAEANQFTSIVIPFGRHFGDAEFYLNCADYTSLELRITFNATVGATGIADNSLYLEVLGLMAMEGPPAPRRGTFKTSRKYNFVTAASGDQVLDLPRANLYRRLLVIVSGEGNTVGGAFSRVSLDVNNGEKIIFAGRVAGEYYKSVLQLGLEQAFAESVTGDTLLVSAIPATLGDVLVIPFDVGNEMANCLNSAVYDKVTLTLSQASAGKSVSIVLQEVLA